MSRRRLAWVLFRNRPWLIWRYARDGQWYDAALVAADLPRALARTLQVQVRGHATIGEGRFQRIGVKRAEDRILAQLDADRATGSWAA